MARVPTMYPTRFLSTGGAVCLTVRAVGMNFKSIGRRRHALNVKTGNCVRKYRYERLPFQPRLVYLLSLLGTSYLAPITQNADDPDYWIRETIKGQGTISTRHKPPRFAWADPAYDLAHASIYPCQLNIARALLGFEPAETTGTDNLKTLQLVFAAYDSAAHASVINFTT